MSSFAQIARNSRKIVGIGRNYADHIKELNNVRPTEPFFFVKPMSSLLFKNEGPVLLPRGVKVHYEVELAIIMGKELKDVKESETDKIYDAIAGYAVGIDMTARNMQEQNKKKGLPWAAAKGFDTFQPISDFIPKEKIPDPHNAELWLTVNDQLKQQDNTNLMLFRIPRLLEHISGIMKLEPNDIILTGTPKGVGPVVHGDVMKAGIRVDGKEIAEGLMEVKVEDRQGGYEFKL